MIFWFFISNLTAAVDAIVWGDNVRLIIPVWCDITTKLMIGANIALPASCLCISIYLEQVASLRRAQSTLADKRKRQWFEAFMGFGLPIIFMGLHVIVQGHRYDLIEGYGCRPTTYYSIPAIFIVWIPPFIMALGSVVYSALALRHFVIRRLTFAAHLQANNSALNTTRYLRLVAMASVQMVGSITVTAYNIWFTAMAIPIRPWTNWADVHSDFWRIDQFLTRFTPSVVQRGFYVVWWMVPIPTFLFVAFFAFGKDAVDEYKKCIDWVTVKVFRMSKSDGKKKFVVGKGLSFVNPNYKSSSKANILPISKPVLQSTTSSDYTLPPSYDMSTSTDSNTRASMSSLGKTETTLHGHNIDKNYDEETPFEYHYQLRASAKFSTNFQQPKAIGSVSDFSILSPSTTVMGCSELTPKALDSGISYPSSTFPAQTRVPVPSYEDLANKPLPPSPTSAALSHAEMTEVVPEPTSASRLRPLLLLGQRENARRPVTYPSHEAERWTPEGAEDARR